MQAQLFVMAYLLWPIDKMRKDSVYLASPWLQTININHMYYATRGWGRQHVMDNFVHNAAHYNNGIEIYNADMKIMKSISERVYESMIEMLW